MDAGDPPVRRGVIVVGEGGFGEEAHRYYLTAIEDGGATYAHGGRVPWPPEAATVLTTPRTAANAASL